ncbi:ATP-dependent DNA helicase RecG [Candidatus Omnitrophota bacterium]
MSVANSNTKKVMDLSTSAQYIKGVGPARYLNLNRLGIHLVGDLLYYFPRRYEDRRTFLSISQLKIGEYATVKAVVLKMSFWRSKKGMSIFQITVTDDSGLLRVIWFNQPFMKRYFKVGQELIIYGKVEKRKFLQINAPDYEFVSETQDAESVHIGRIVPIYRLSAKINQRYLRTVIYRAEQGCRAQIADMLPVAIKKRLDLLPLAEAISAIHFPEEFPAKDSAYRRLVFDEFFLLQMILALKKSDQKLSQSGIAHKLTGKLSQAFLKSLPFKLTAGQVKAIQEIKQDLAQPKPMNRLLQGEVGSGKTVVAAYSLVLSVQSNFQAALMAPTEILAEQHYLLLSRIFAPLGINVGMLISSMSPKLKANTIQDIESGSVDVIIGTHALLEQEIKFKQLGLVVIDEQHKFGVLQRAGLRQKGKLPDCLVMTATPIPRTLAMTVYGDLDISTIRELPKGRLAVSTIWIKPEANQQAYQFIREEITQGRQAYIVYPLIEESPALELKAATEMYAQLKQDVFADYQIALIHGQIKPQEKEAIMRGFKQRKIDILVSTTVIEVGIDIPNATVMMVEDAERFGLSQLHQLRGRIGRGQHRSYCILVSDPQTEKAKMRIQAMLETDDGFRIAEQDLDIRGPGRFFGPAQHGLPELKIGNIISDMEIMELARREAFALVQADPALKSGQHQLLRQRLKQRFSGSNLSLLSA